MSIRREITINANPAAVYRVLTNSGDFVRMTGGRSADISKEIGGAVSLFGGDIRALNIELLPDKRVRSGLAVASLAGRRLLDSEIRVTRTRGWDEVGLRSDRTSAGGAVNA